MRFLRYLYYELKPYLPFGARMAFRRALARGVLARSHGCWPILAEAAQIPDGWPGWPDQKRFALVLTHDVEGEKGLNQTLKLAQLEESLGFKSSFNFVPEGTYSTPASLRRELRKRGFEIGVHDLRHDGKLYRSEKLFRKAAPRINHHLHDWKATGFRSGFMHHNLEWLHYLDIAYDMSTFDTDPFEPQPDGVHTIFPFWVPASGSATRYGDELSGGVSRSGSGYVELPYTLAQDSTVYLLLQHSDPKIWKLKLDWIAKTGGMALLNVHPDYMAFTGAPNRGEYSAEIYSDFLKYVLATYRDQYWPALPSQVAAHVRDVNSANGALSGPFRARAEAAGKLPLPA